jgi:hypothetical protein
VERSQIDVRLESLGIELPRASAPGANDSPLRARGKDEERDFEECSGGGPDDADGAPMRRTIGAIAGLVLTIGFGQADPAKSRGEEVPWQR